jgi:outer membrane protein OmpA-like peptidoglycan-associated protein
MLHLQMGQEVLYLIMTVGIMTSIVLLLYVGSLRTRYEELEARYADVEASRASASAEGDDLRAQLGALLATAEAQAEPKSELNDQPPIITLSEAQGYFFPSGSAVLSDDFRVRISRQIIPRIVQIGQRYNAEVIEVVGHTDEVPLRSSRSTADKDLLDFLNHEQESEPSVADNVGLGMIRAAAVARVLREDLRLSGFVVLAMSAGQTITTGQHISPGYSPPRDDRRRRRIEIRVRRRSKE